MEEEITLNTTFNTTDEFSLEEPFSWYELILPVTAILGCIVSTSMVCIILGHRTLHSRPYYCIAHVCICYSLYLLLCPMIYEIVPRLHNHLPTTFICMGADGMFAAWFGNLASLLILLLEWYIPVHYSRPSSSKYIRFSTFISISAGVFTAILFLTGIITCTHGFYFPISILLALLTYLVVFVVILILTIIHFVKMKTRNIVAVESNVILYIVIAYFLCWLAHWFMLVVHFFKRFKNAHPMWFISANFLTFICPGVIFLILYKFDEKFRKCICKSWGKNRSEVSVDETGVRSTTDNNQFQTLI